MSLTEQDLERIEERIDRKLASHFEQMDERFDRLEDSILLLSLYLPGQTPTKESHVPQRVRKILRREEAVL